MRLRPVTTARAGSATGSYSYTSTQPYAREYRVVFPTDGVVWGSVSPTPFS